MSTSVKIGWGLSAVLSALAGSAAGQTATFQACYVPSVGAMYLIKLPGLPTACLHSSHVPVIWTDGVADGSVTTIKLADGAVTTAKLAADVTIPLADGSVTTAKLANNAVTAPKLGPNSVTSAHVADRSITGADLAAGTVGTSELGDLVVATGNLADGSVTPAKLSTGILPGGNLASGSTIRGLYVFNWTATATDGHRVSAFSFGYALSSAPIQHFIPLGGSGVAGCPGTASEPQADPGHLCVYEEFRIGSPTWAFGSPSRWGAFVAAVASNTGLTESSGTWAVTAP